MKVAILNLTGGGISGGHKKYLQNMLPLLAAAPEVEAVLCAAPASMAVQTWLPPIPKVSYAVCEPFRPFRHIPDSGLRAALDAFSPDLLFIPVERYINYRDLPVVVMLQNMAPLAHVKTGAGLKEVLIGMARRYETRVALRRAAQVIVPTQYVKHFLAKSEGIPAEKISAVHYGHNAPVPDVLPPAGFPFPGQEFILTAGSMEFYRGIEDLLCALPGIKEKRPGVKLAIAGGARPATEKYLSGLKKTAEKLGLSNDVAWLGNLPEAELSWCYANCAAFALTSRMESFCFVALEALSHGCALVSAESACLPEILGGAAEYYKAGDCSALELALFNAISLDPEKRKSKAAFSLERGTAFSWEKAVESTLQVFSRTKSTK